jgi:hypothetical protein
MTHFGNTQRPQIGGRGVALVRRNLPTGNFLLSRLVGGSIARVLLGVNPSHQTTP